MAQIRKARIFPLLFQPHVLFKKGLAWILACTVSALNYPGNAKRLQG